jgi:tRNA threonylcarbamoyladenosine biosynthesis protein TsaB
MRILAIDTTAEFGSVAAAEDGAVVAELLLHSPEGFSRTVFEHVRAVLDRAGWSAGDVDCFAAAAGPGSFTGVRVGLAAAKGLAEALGKRAAAVSTLEAVASFGTAERRAALLDARRGQIYGAVYPGGSEVVAPLPEWLASLPPGEIEFLSTGFAPFRDALAGRWMTEVPRALAGAVARIAAARTPVDPAAIDANYVRRSDAELFWRDR